MKRNLKKVEDFKNLPVAKATNEFSAAESLEILMDNEISNIMGGINPPDKSSPVCVCEHGGALSIA